VDRDQAMSRRRVEDTKRRKRRPGPNRSAKPDVLFGLAPAQKSCANKDISKTRFYVPRIFPNTSKAGFNINIQHAQRYATYQRSTTQNGSARAARQALLSSERGRRSEQKEREKKERLLDWES